jgi:hypothetical protein
MNEFDEIQRRNWGASQAPLNPAIYADLMRQAIEQAIQARSDLQVIHVKLTIQSEQISLTADISYTQSQPPALPPPPPPQIAGIIIGQDDE